MLIPNIHKTRSRIAVAVRTGQHAQADEARRDLVVAKLDEHIETALASPHSLTQQQREYFAARILGGTK